MKPAHTANLEELDNQNDPALWYAGLFALVVVFLGAVLWKGFAHSQEAVGEPLSSTGSVVPLERPVEAFAPEHQAVGKDPHPQLRKRHGRTDREAFAENAEKRLHHVQKKLSKIEERPGADAIQPKVEEMNKQARHVSTSLENYDDPNSSVTQDEVEMSLSDLEHRLDGASEQLSLAR